MTIKTKRKDTMCDNLTNNKEYTIVGLILDPSTSSGYSFLVFDDSDTSNMFDSEFFRLRSLKMNN